MILFYWLILIMPLEKHPFWAHHFAGLTVVKYIGLACLAYAFAYLPMRKGLPPLWATAQARFFVLFFLIAALSYVVMGNHEHLSVENPLTMYTSFFLLFFITLTTVDSPRRLRRVLLTAIGSIGFASLYVIREWQKGGFASGFRPGWVVGDPNYFTVSAAACLPLALYLAIVSRQRLERLYCVGCSVSTLGAVVLGASRGGLIALAVSCTWLVLQTRQRWKLLGVLVFLLIPIFVIAPSSPFRRLFHPNWGDAASTSNHVMVLKAGLRMIRAHPFVGVGLGNFQGKILAYADPSLSQALVAHDAYLEVAAEMGVPALFVYLAMLGFGLRCLSRARQTAVALDLKFLESAAVGLKAGLIGSSTALLFVSGQNTKLYWLVLFLSMVLPSLAVATGKQAEDLPVSSQDPMGIRSRSIAVRPDHSLEGASSASRGHSRAIRQGIGWRKEGT